jgi:hypothetical protein
MRTAFIDNRLPNDCANPKGMMACGGFMDRGKIIDPVMLAKIFENSQGCHLGNFLRLHPLVLRARWVKGSFTPPR